MRAKSRTVTSLTKNEQRPRVSHRANSHIEQKRRNVNREEQIINENQPTINDLNMKILAVTAQIDTLLASLPSQILY